ncbi:hypothetical protein ACHAW6_001648 [Cyclotella cf. meneghiniana]
MSYGCIFSVLSLILLFLPECGATKLTARKLFHRRVHLRSSHYLAKNPNSCFASLNISFRQTRQVSRFSFAPGLRPTAHRNPLGSRWILRGTKSNDPPKSLPPQRNSRQIFQFFAIYIILPFLICTILNMTNDIYVLSKEQFNSALASSGFDPQITTPGSDEYIALSNLYNESMQSLFILLLSKRLALYLIATVATIYAGWRSYGAIRAAENGSIGGPGEALDRLNREILKGENFDFNDSEAIDCIKQSLKEEKEIAKNEENLLSTLIDQSPQSSNIGRTIAILLPLVLTASLVISYEIVVASDVKNAAIDAAGDTFWSETYGWVSTYLPYLTALPSLTLCLLFTSAEFRRFFPPKYLMLTSNSIALRTPVLCTGNIVAFFYVTGAYLAKSHPTLTLNESIATSASIDLWPLQNGVNVALATTVTRALAPFLVSTSSNTKKSIRTIALALIGVTLFDAISVFGTVVNAAMNAMPTESSSIMARSKLASVSRSPPLVSPWQPGLLEIVIGHGNAITTDALGLGDVVFPACLVAWGLHADACCAASDVDVSTTDEVHDRSINHSKIFGNNQYTFAAIAGYLFGSFLTEIVGSFSFLGKGAGLPALVFLVPAMLMFVLFVSWRKGEIEEVWGHR